MESYKQNKVSRAHGANRFLRRAENNLCIGAIAVALAVSPVIAAGQSCSSKVSTNTNPSGTGYTTVVGQQKPQEDANIATPDKSIVKLENKRIFFGNGTSKWATGWYVKLSPTCYAILGPYHVAVRMKKPIDIGGEKISKPILATGPKAAGARYIPQSSGPPLKYNPVYDAAFWLVPHPIPGMQSVTFTKKLKLGEPVTIYSYPSKGPISSAYFHPIGGQLKISVGKFIATLPGGILEFEADGIKPGSSGGLAFNQRGEAVGMVWGSKGNKVFADPAWALAEAARKKGLPFQDIQKTWEDGQLETLNAIDQDIEAEIESTITSSFGGVDPTPILSHSYLYKGMNNALKPLPPIQVDVSHRRAEESAEIQTLRKKVMEVINGMEGYGAIMTAETAGDKVEEETFQHEINLIKSDDGLIDIKEVNTRTPGGEKTYRLPQPKAPTWTTFGNDWLTAPEFVWTDQKLHIESMGSRTLEDNQVVKVFQYEAEAEDEDCQFISASAFREHLYDLPCRGEIWTDDQLNVLFFSKHMSPPKSTDWEDVSVVVLYGWLKEDGKQPHLVPISTLQRSNHLDGADHLTYWCEAQFTNYQKQK